MDQLYLYTIIINKENKMFEDYSRTPETASLVYPKNVFKMQNKMSDNLNSFQTHYGRYMRCQNQDTAMNVDPPCDFVGEDSFSELRDAYRNLMNDLNELDDVYEKQSTYDGKQVKIYTENEEQLDENYEKLTDVRKELDGKLKQLQIYSDAKIEPQLIQLKSVNLINTILVITLLYLIYVIFVDF